MWNFQRIVNFKWFKSIWLQRSRRIPRLKQARKLKGKMRILKLVSPIVWLRGSIMLNSGYCILNHIDNMILHITLYYNTQILQDGVQDIPNSPSLSESFRVFPSLSESLVMCWCDLTLCCSRRIPSTNSLFAGLNHYFLQFNAEICWACFILFQLHGRETFTILNPWPFFPAQP